MTDIISLLVDGIHLVLATQRKQQTTRLARSSGMSSRATVANSTKKTANNNRKTKSVTIELSSDDDIQELVTGYPKMSGSKKAVASSTNGRPTARRNGSASQATGFGGVSCEPITVSPSSSAEYDDGSCCCS